MIDVVLSVPHSHIQVGELEGLRQRVAAKDQKIAQLSSQLGSKLDAEKVNNKNVYRI